MLAKPEFTTCSRGVISPPWWKQQFFSSASAFLHPPTNEEVVQHPPKKVDKIRERRRRTYFFNFFPGKSWSNFGISAELELWVSRFYVTRRRRIKAVALPLHSSFACRNFIYSALPPRRREEGEKAATLAFPLSCRDKIFLFSKKVTSFLAGVEISSRAHTGICVCVGGSGDFSHFLWPFLSPFGPYLKDTYSSSLSPFFVVSLSPQPHMVIMFDSPRPPLGA